MQPRFDPAAPILVLSPHFDDAALDCWSVLSLDRDVVVANVFAGIPSRGTLLWQDRGRGFSDSASYVQARMSEDSEALAATGSTVVNLPLMDSLHRGAIQLPVPQLVARLARRPGRNSYTIPGTERMRHARRQVAAALPTLGTRWSLVCAPSGIGGHPDHRVVRDAAVHLSRSCNIPVRLYADLPYCLGGAWPRALVNDPTANVVHLDDRQADAKVRAVRTYRTQFDELDALARGALSNRATYGLELYWNVS